MFVNTPGKAGTSGTSGTRSPEISPTSLPCASQLQGISEHFLQLPASSLARVRNLFRRVGAAISSLRAVHGLVDRKRHRLLLALALSEAMADFPRTLRLARGRVPHVFALGTEASMLVQVLIRDHCGLALTRRAGCIGQLGR